MTATEAALSGLIDYAGLYPPAALDIHAAVRNYLGYLEQKHAWVLGRFIVDVGRLDELREAAGTALSRMRLSVIAPATANASLIARHIEAGIRIESVEIKCDEPLAMARTCDALPPNLECYFEVPLQQVCCGAGDAIAAVGARAKLRMGGVVPEAIPASQQVVEQLQLLAHRSVPFKATAGLHHPVRSRHHLSYEPDSPAGTMHGFINLFCAAAVLCFDGIAEEARDLLGEENPGAFRITAQDIAARGHQWSADQLRRVRQFFISFGSCSFTEPISDLEALGWL